MKRSLLSGTALLFVAMFGPAAFAADSGGEQISPSAQISPMTSALVQGAQAKVLFPQAKVGTQNTDPNSATGNPALDRTLGVNAAANSPRKTLQTNLSAKAQTLLQQKQAAQAAAAAQGQDVTFASGGTGDGLQSGGIPVINVTKNITRNVTNNSTTNTTNNTTNQTGNITNVKAVTKVIGNDNAVVQTVQGVGNGNTFVPTDNLPAAAARALATTPPSKKARKEAAVPKEPN